ncbi:MAG TPA: outer membrane lipoprotein carrier protein LolA [Bacteroidales bacterium]|nr:outer membrane lipoprotein carrier protein LolA [Bacteroidales bacterium]
MKIRIIIFVLLIFWLTDTSAQTDPAALKILDRFSANALSAPSVSIRFQLVNDDLAENSSDTLTGSVIISKENYKLDLPNNTVWFNGNESWSYLEAEKEVTITRPDKKDNSFQSKPSGIFTLHKKGYKTRLIDENASAWIIDLYPEDVKSEIIRIRLTIGKTATDLKRIEYKRNDGVVITILVTDYNLKLKPDSETFQFRSGKYKDVEIVDMR